MADTQTQVAATPGIRMAAAEDLSLRPPAAPEDLPPPPPKETFSRLQQQRQANELRRLYKHIHPELRKNLAEAVAEDLAEVLGSQEPTEGDVQCMRWIFENWRLDAIGEHERPAAKEPVSGGDIQATTRKFKEGSFNNSTDDQEAAGHRPSGGDVRATRKLFETQPLDALSGQKEAPGATAREPAASGDVRGTKILFETQPLDHLGSRPSTHEQSPLELRSEIQELKGDVQKTVKLFQTEPLCAIQDAGGAIHEVKAACREEIQSHAVRTARWLFETRPLDAFNQDPSQVRVIRGISLEEGARPDVSATRWIFETQPLDAIREILVDEKDFQPSPDLVPPGPDVQHQRHLFETQALDTLKGEEEEVGPGAPPKEQVIPGDVRSTLWLFETKPLDAFNNTVQVGHLQRVGHQEGEGLRSERLPSGDTSASPLSQGGPPSDGLKGDVKTFKNLFETIPLDSIGQGESSAGDGGKRAGDAAGGPQGTASPVYAMQDSRGQLHALTSVSREQVVGGDVRGYKWMFETQPLDQLGRSPSTVDVVRGITRQEVVAGDVGTARWLFETQPLEVIHQREQQERREEEGKGRDGSQAEALPKGNVQTLRWVFETCPTSELTERQGSEATERTSKTEVQSCTWMFGPQLDRMEGSREQHLQVNQIQAGERQTDGHVFETEPLPTAGQPCARRPVRYCSRVEIPSGQVSRQKEVFQALETAKKDPQEFRTTPRPIPSGSVHKFTWLFENCPMDSLAAESVGTGGSQEEKPKSPSDHRTPERQETAAEGTLRVLHATPGLLHHGGILMESRGPGEVCLAKFVLPGPGRGRPYTQKEELVSGELPGILRQVLRRPDVDQQGLLVWEDAAGRLRLHPLTLPGDMGNLEDMDPQLQQMLACGLGISTTRTGLVMQETGRGLVSLTAYSLQPWQASGAPERHSVQQLASCIDQGDLSGLQSLRWEPPADPGSAPVREDAQKLPVTENIIHVTPLEPTVEMGHPRNSGTTPCPPPAPAVGKAGLPMGTPAAGAPALQEARKQADGSLAGQKGTATSAKSGGTWACTPGSRTPDLQEAMQSLRKATSEAQRLHQQLLDRQPQSSNPAAAPTPLQGGLPQALATGPTQGHVRPVTRSDTGVPAAPRKVSGDEHTLPRGLPGGRGPVQDGIYAARPVSAFDPPGSAWEPQPRGRETALSTQAPSPPRAGLGLPAQQEAGDHTRGAWAAPGKGARGGPEGFPAADAALKTAPLAHCTLASGPQHAADKLHPHNASVPPPPALPAAVTGPDRPAQAHPHEDSTQQASQPHQDPLLHSHSSPNGQTAKSPKAEPTTPPRKKPPVPPKPAHLASTHPPQRPPKPSALSSNFSAARQEFKPGEPNAASGQQAEVRKATGQDCLPLAGDSRGRSHLCPQHSPSAVAATTTKDQAGGSNARSPELPTFSILNDDSAALQRGSSPPREQPMDCSKQGTPENPEILPGSQQALQGLLGQVQALEKETTESVDVQTLRKLFEAAPQVRGTDPEVPTDPHKPEVSVEQAFGELTRVSTEVARLKEQTLARLLDLEEAVHKALTSVSSLQPAAHKRSHPAHP